MALDVARAAISSGAGGNNTPVASDPRDITPHDEDVTLKPHSPER